MTKKNFWIPAIITFLILILGIWFLFANSETNIEVTSNGQTKVIKLSSSQAGQYDPSEIRVKAGTQVRIEGDPQTLVGGMDTVVVEGYGINKKISESDNIIEFVANKPGKYEIRCANYMGNANLIVE